MSDWQYGFGSGRGSGNGRGNGNGSGEGSGNGRGSVIILRDIFALTFDIFKSSMLKMSTKKHGD
jgi:uncharacterized spore protein YtfJ